MVKASQPTVCIDSYNCLVLQLHGSFFTVKK